MKYTDLHIHTEYTRGNGITDIPSLVSKAVALGMDSLAITDSGSLAGIPEFFKECRRQGIRPLAGCGFYYAPSGLESDETHHLVLLAKNIVGFQNLKELSSWSFSQGMGMKPRIDKNILKKHSCGLIALSGGLGGVIDKPWLLGEKEKALAGLKLLQDIFSEDFYLEFQDNGVENNRKMRTVLKELAAEHSIKTVVTGGSFYLTPEDAQRCNSVRKEQGNKILPGKGYCFKGEEEILTLFRDDKASVEESRKIVSSMEDIFVDENESFL